MTGLIDRAVHGDVASTKASAGRARIKLLQFATVFDVGGTERHLVNLCRSLDRSVFELEIGCTNRGGKLLGEIERQCVPILDFPISNLYGPASFLQRLRFARELSRRQTAIVHSYNFHANLFAVPAARLACVPVVVASIRDNGTHLSPSKRQAQRHVCRLADHVVVNADSIRQRLVRLGYAESTITVIRNGIDLDGFDSATRVDERRIQPDLSLRRQLRLPDDSRLVVLLARLDPVKRVEDFLDAAAIVTPLVEGARFLVVGDDVITTKRGQRPESPYRKELLSHAARIGLADRVIFTGMRFDVSRLLAQADVSVLCSSSEGLSNTILESMAAGLPVVATDVGGTAEIVDDGQTGLLVRPFQPASIAGAIVRLLQEPELARRLGRAGREKVERHFTLRRMVSETERLYERLLEQHHSRTAGSGHLTLRDRPEPASPSSSVSFAVTPSTAVTSEAHRDEVTIATVADVGGFAALRDEWTELLSDSRADCLFLTWEWLFTWWKHFGHGRQLSILTVRSGARLVAVAPLVAQRSGPLGFWTLSTLEFLGRGSVGSDYLDIIVRNGYEDQALSVLASRLALQNVGVSFAQVRMGRRLRRDRAAAMNLARSLSARRWRVVCAVTDVCPYIDLRGHSWTSYLDSVGPALRYNFRRRLRNLEKMGPVRFEPAVTPADCRVSLDRLIDFHNRRWIEKGGSQAFHQPALVEFHREFTPLALERGWLRMLSLTIGDTPVSLLYCLRYGRSFLGYQSGFDVQYRRHSVGLVSVGLAIRMAIGEGADEYDFLHGNEGYKDHWSSHRRQLARLDLFPSHFRGAVGHRGFELHNFARRMAKGFIQRVRPAEAGSKNSNEAP